VLGLSRKSQPPHVRWPEIMHWRKGDKFSFGFGTSLSAGHTQGQLLSVTEDGYAYFDFCGDHFCLPISWVVGQNQGLQNRRISQAVKDSDEYMELIKQFNVAFDELQRRDKQNGIAA
jgi:hypothetical protein